MSRNAPTRRPVGADVPEDDLTGRGLPRHIDEAIQSIAKLHAAHHQGASQLQRTLGKAASLIAHPLVVGVLPVLAICWIGFNFLGLKAGYSPPDPPPFAWLTNAIALASFYMVALIYATQRREDQLSELREQLTLELALLNEQKTAKVIQLLEEFRRDTPLVHDRVDHQANAMAEPVDTERVLEAIKETHAEAEQAQGAER